MLLHASAGIGSLQKFNDALRRIEGILCHEGADEVMTGAWERFKLDQLQLRPGGGPCFAPRATLRRAGIVAQARIVDCIAPGDGEYATQVGFDLGMDAVRWWFPDQFGYVLADVKPLPYFTPWKAGLGLRKAPAQLLEQLGLAREAA